MDGVPENPELILQDPPKQEVDGVAVSSNNDINDIICHHCMINGDCYIGHTMRDVNGKITCAKLLAKMEPQGIVVTQKNFSPLQIKYYTGQPLFYSTHPMTPNFGGIGKMPNNWNQNNYYSTPY